jgi:hypothetical protein
MTGYHQIIMDRLVRSQRLLTAYNERRQELLSDAQVYTIGAFNNEGKRVTFQIPAPGLKTRCIFTLDGQSFGAAGRPPTPDDQPNRDSTASSCDHGAHSISSRDELATTAAIYRINRHYSSPPDVLLDVHSASDAAQLVRSSIIGPIRSLRRRSMNGDEKVNALMSGVTGLGDDVHGLIRHLIGENIEQLQQIQLLAAKVDEMSWLNQVMGDKVKTFSEDLIQQKQKRTSRWI